MLRRLLLPWTVSLALVVGCGGTPSTPRPAAQPTPTPPALRAAEAELKVGALTSLTECIPEPGQRVCDRMRTMLWNGEVVAWTRRGVTDSSDVFNETVVLRARAGDPHVIANLAYWLHTPYVQITRLRFIGTQPGQVDEFIEVTNLGSRAQDMTGWTVRSPARGVVLPFPTGFVLQPGQSCRIYTGLVQADSCGGASFNRTDVWPDDGGVAVLFYDALALPGVETRYRADPANQPPPPNLQLVTSPAPAAPAP
jgi:hypothetical protein